MCWYHSAWSKRHRNIVLVKQVWVFAVEAGGGPTWEFSLLDHRTSPWPPIWCSWSCHLPPFSPPFPSVHPDAHSSVQATGMLDSASYVSLLSVWDFLSFLPLPFPRLIHLLPALLPKSLFRFHSVLQKEWTIFLKYKCILIILFLCLKSWDGLPLPLVWNSSLLHNCFLNVSFLC